MEGKYSFLDIGDLPEDDDLPAGDPESSEDNFRSDEFLILPKDNYLSELPLDIVAFHFSEPGACGYHGVLRIITGDKRKFMVQYFHDDWDEVNLYKVSPVLEATHKGFAGYNVTLRLGLSRYGLREHVIFYK